MRFDEVNLDENVLQGIEAMNFQEMTPVQEQTIPVILEGKDIIGCAQTGTGKTAAYTLPLLSRLVAEGNPDNHIRAVNPKRYTKRFQVSFLWFFYFQTERWIDMPRMSKKRKQEWALFLNDRNRITYNELCRKCRNDCKQSFRCVVVHCPKYLSKRRTKNYEND